MEKADRRQSDRAKKKKKKKRRYDPNDSSDSTYSSDSDESGLVKTCKNSTQKKKKKNKHKKKKRLQRKRLLTAYNLDNVPRRLMNQPSNSPSQVSDKNVATKVEQLDSKLSELSRMREASCWAVENCKDTDKWGDVFTSHITYNEINANLPKGGGDSLTAEEKLLQTPQIIIRAPDTKRHFDKFKHSFKAAASALMDTSKYGDTKVRTYRSKEFGDVDVQVVYNKNQLCQALYKEQASSTDDSDCESSDGGDSS